MTTVQVLGTGCKKCLALKANVEAALEQSGLAAKIEKIEDVNRIVEFGVLTTPALAIDGQVKIIGRVASPDEIAALLPKIP
jgi:small redox-active disulfide protein 2